MEIVHILLLTIIGAFILPAVKAKINKDYKISTVNSEVVDGFTGGLYWDGEHNRLYWLEMGYGDDPRSIVCYDPDTGVTFKATIGGKLRPLVMAIRVEGTQDMFLIGVGGALALIRWDCTSNRDINPVEVFHLENGKRFNDGKADSSGSLWAGTLKPGPKPGWFDYRFASINKIDEGKQLKRMFSRKEMMNGMEWSLDDNTIFFMDSWNYNIYKFNYDREKKELGKSRWAWYTLDEATAKTPEYISGYGLTIDNEGQLWIPGNGLGTVFRIDHEKEGPDLLVSVKAAEITIPETMWPTSVCFGGKDLDILFVTTARFDWTKILKKKNKYPNLSPKEYTKSGYTFMITGLGVKGARPSRPVKIPNDMLKKCC
ncbi:regucalcin-like [Macrosteles quadrilineatus]|uniref:regucalcin-like n=1 Tax=Macrosteles quadrilineatus TaxID=74068 RepID=UPI0023E0CB6C|nr:regucalcin-like [Macrosteles quadrilineatus]